MVVYYNKSYSLDSLKGDRKGIILGLGCRVQGLGCAAQGLGD